MPARTKSTVFTTLLNNIPYVVFLPKNLQNKWALILTTILSFSHKQIRRFVLICVGTALWSMWWERGRAEGKNNNRLHSGWLLETSLLPVSSDPPVSAFLFCFLSSVPAVDVLPPHSSCSDYIRTNTYSAAFMTKPGCVVIVWEVCEHTGYIMVLIYSIRLLFYIVRYFDLTALMC